MVKRNTPKVELNDQTLGHLKGKRDQVIAATRTLELAAQQVAAAMKDFHSQYVSVIGNAKGWSQESIDTLQMLNIESLPDLTSVISTGSALDSAISERVGKKRKRENDENRPKKPMTIFLAFSTKQRAIIREQRAEDGLPPLLNAELAKEVTRLWGLLSEQEKDKYRAQYQERLIEYNAKKRAYLNQKSGTPTNGSVPIDTVESAHKSNEVDDSDDDDLTFADALEHPEEIDRLQSKQLIPEEHVNSVEPAKSPKAVKKAKLGTPSKTESPIKAVKLDTPSKSGSSSKVSTPRKKGKKAKKSD